MRVKTKWEMYNERYSECDYCEEPMPANDMECHIHHTIVFKSDLPKSKQQGIDDPINLMLVHANPCHEILQSDREAGYEYKLEQESNPYTAKEDWTDPESFGYEVVKKARAAVEALRSH